MIGTANCQVKAMIRLGPVAKFASEPRNGRVDSAFKLGCPRMAVVKCGSARPIPQPFSNFATCVDAGFGARRIFWIGAARGRVLTCVRPLMRLTRRRPGWEFADQLQVRPTRLKRLSQSWFS